MQDIGYRIQDSGFRINSFILPTADCPLPTADCRLPTAHWLLTTDRDRIVRQNRLDWKNFVAQIRVPRLDRLTV
jgi:hypothetical protein